MALVWTYITPEAIEGLDMTWQCAPDYIPNQSELWYDLRLKESKQ